MKNFLSLLCNTSSAGVQVPEGMWLRAEGEETQPRGWAGGCGEEGGVWGWDMGQSRDVIFLNRVAAPLGQCLCSCECRTQCVTVDPSPLSLGSDYSDRRSLPHSKPTGSLCSRGGSLGHPQVQPEAPEHVEALSSLWPAQPSTVPTETLPNLSALFCLGLTHL